MSVDGAASGAALGHRSSDVEPAAQPSGEQLRQLNGYIELLSKWNRVYNLTAVREPSQMMERHVEDCLCCVTSLAERYVPGKMVRLLDVGSGGGLPGVVIAIMLPQFEVTCIDAVGKKTAFIQQVASTLDLGNLHSLHIRAEDLSGEFDVIASRAFSTLRHLIDVTKQAISVNGVWMAMKGKVPHDELDELDRDKVKFHVEQLSSGSDASRCLVWMNPLSTDKSALASPINH